MSTPNPASQPDRNPDVQNITETLGIGSRAPDFRLAAANSDRTFELKDLLSRTPVILEFLRGTWCPNCRKRMVELEGLKAEIEQAAGALVCIAAEKREGMWKPETFLQSHPLSFPFLLDEDRAVTKAYGLYHRIGIDAIDIAHPATLVVDREARVRYIYRGSGQTDRSPMAEVLKALRKAASGAW